MKKCTKCGQEHEAIPEYFTVAKLNKDGLDIYCRPCRRAIAKDFYQKNRLKEIERSKRWNKINASKVARNMANCRKKNPSKYRAYDKQWKKENKLSVYSYDCTKRQKRRAAINNTACKATAKDVQIIIKKSKGLCYYCGKKDKMTLDHVIPLSKGGLHEKANLVAACSHCNTSKGNRDPIAFARKHGLLIV